MSDVSKTNDLIAEAEGFARTHMSMGELPLARLLQDLAAALEAATRVPVQGEPNVCLDHKPVQHRDGKPPWCNTCGRATVPDAATAAVERVRAVLSNDELVWSDGSYTNVLVVEVKDVLAALDGAPETGWQYGLQDADGFVSFRNLSLKSLRKRAKQTGEVIVRRRPASKWLPVEGESKP